MIYLTLLLACACCCGIFAADCLPDAGALWPAAMAAALMLALLLRRRRPCLMAFLILALFCAGAWRLQQEAAAYSGLPDHLVGHTLWLEGEILEKRNSYDGDKGRVTRYALALEKFSYAGEERQRAGSGTIYVTLPAEPSWPNGSHISLTATLRPITYYRNGGMFDARHRDKRQAVIATAYHQEKTPVTLVREPRGWQRFLGSLRSRITEQYMQVLKREQAFLLSSLVFGGHYDELPPALLQSFCATGLIHILSVSGSHISLLLAAVQVLGGAVRLRGRSLFLASAVLVLAYGALAEFTAPVVRSVIMGLISAYSLVARRDYTSFHALALAVLAMTLYSPYLVFDLSFRLSCGASAGIVLLQPRVRACLCRLPRFLCDGLAVCISAQLLLVPLLFSYFHSFPVYSFLANLTVAPVLDSTIVLGLAASVAGPVFPFLAKPVLALAGTLLAAAVKANYFIAALPGSRFWSGAPPVLVSLAWYCGLAAVCACRWRRMLACVAAVLLVCHYAYAFITKPDISVYVFDMGNDRATCAVADDSSTSLWYNKSRWSNPEQVSCVLVPALQHLGVFSLSHVYVSGHEQERTARQLCSHFAVKNVTLSGAAARIFQVYPGPVPYYVAGEFPDRDLPQPACLEIRSFDKARRIPFPEGATALILQRDRRSNAVWEDWRENADYYGIPVYSTYEGGEILAVRKGTKWKISYGGDS